MLLYRRLISGKAHCLDERALFARHSWPFLSEFFFQTVKRCCIIVSCYCLSFLQIVSKNSFFWMPSKQWPSSYFALFCVFSPFIVLYLDFCSHSGVQWLIHISFTVTNLRKKSGGLWLNIDNHGVEISCLWLAVLVVSQQTQLSSGQIFLTCILMKLVFHVDLNLLKAISDWQF